MPNEKNRSTESGVRVVMFAAEAVPYAKVGGLGDVVGALPKEMAKLGAKPTVIIPAYRSIDFNRFQIKPCAAVPGFDVPMGSFCRTRRGVPDHESTNRQWTCF